ncbi:MULTISPECIES: hypothetical protein [Chryseobacterium]|uniref:hypothetical protein n=1 Tax=Chryseobacterium TaxID=59732 RepID=UPI000595D64F|nr:MULTISPECIES: hypothetical protein [Chryseobacterium]WBX98517.1 hypothetical protein PE065_04465 [Chryseobacterium gambrini]
MSTDKEFFAPRLTGHRFDDHTLPVSILEDFSAFEELIFELAKKIYLEQNPQRKRVPKGFTDNVYLKLSDLEEGSTIPKFLIAVVTSITTPTIPVPNTEYFNYFEDARDKVFDVVESANSGRSVDIDSKYLNYFNRIGKNLEEGETIDFLNVAGSERNVKFTRNTRRKILLSREEKLEYSENIQENILISSVDKKNQTFNIEIDGQIFEHSIISDFAETIISAFNEYEKKTLVSINATGIFNEQNKLIHIEEIESMDILDPFDVSVRLNELIKLNDRWYDGIDGKSLNKEQVNLFENLFENYFDSDLILPAIFPTIQGDIVLEWKNENVEVSFEVNLEDLTGKIFYFDMNSDENDYEKIIDLKIDEEWSTLNSIISEL